MEDKTQSVWKLGVLRVRGTDDFQRVGRDSASLFHCSDEKPIARHVNIPVLHMIDSCKELTKEAKAQPIYPTADPEAKATATCDMSSWGVTSSSPFTLLQDVVTWRNRILV